MTSISSAVCFALALFLAPVFLAIPSEATAPALFLVGVMMMHDIRKVNFTDYANAIPCFVCISVMPLTYSISDGILLSLITYVAIRLLAGRWKNGPMILMYHEPFISSSMYVKRRRLELPRHN